MEESVMWWVQKNLPAFGVLSCKVKDALVQPCPTVIALWDNGTCAIPAHEDRIRSQCGAEKRVLEVDLPGVASLSKLTLGVESLPRRPLNSL